MSPILTRPGRRGCHPTNYWRIGEAIYLHGGHKSGLMRAIGRGERLSIAVTLEDGLVLGEVCLRP